MSDDFIRSLGLGFLAHRLKRTSELILEESAAALRPSGLEVPSRGASTITLLRNEGPRSITEIAFRLQLSHPLVIQLTNRLERARLVRSRPDKTDARRRLISLTKQGEEVADRIFQFSDALADTFAEMFEEAGKDLLAALEGFEAASSRRSIAQRVTAHLGRRSIHQGADR